MDKYGKINILRGTQTTMKPIQMDLRAKKRKLTLQQYSQVSEEKPNLKWFYKYS